jgi:threonine synthase
LEQARSQAPDLIILDLMMPELDGFGLLEALRSDPKTNAIPVIVISAKDLSEVERRWLGIHTDGLVQKGALKPGTFVDQVVEVLEGKRAPEGER